MVIIVDNTSHIVLLAGDDRTASQITIEVNANDWSDNCRPAAGTFTCYTATLPPGYLDRCYTYSGGTFLPATATDLAALAAAELARANLTIALTGANVVALTGVLSDGVTQVGFNVTWPRVISASGYEIQYKIAGGTYVSVQVTDAGTGINQTSLITGLAVNTLYYLKIAAITHWGPIWSNEITQTTASAAAGSGQKSVTISCPSGFIFTYAKPTDLTPNNYTALVLTADLTRGLTTYQWAYGSGSSWVDFAGATVSTFSLAASAMTATTMAIRCMSGTTAGYTTITKVYGGADGFTGSDGKSYSLSIDAGSRTITYDGTGANPSPATVISYTCSLYVDGVLKTPVSYSWTCGGILSSATVTTATFSPVIASAFALANTFVTLVVTYNWTTISATIPIVAVKNGSTGLPGGPGPGLTVSTTPPSSPVQYQLWFNSGTADGTYYANTQYQYVGTTWIPTSPRGTKIGADGIYTGTLTATQVNAINISATQVNAGTLSGINLTIGSANNICNVNSSGISLGNATFASAPFRVDMAGNLTATGATISGDITLTNTLSADKVVDGTTNKTYTGTEQIKLSGVATGATKNTMSSGSGAPSGGSNGDTYFDTTAIVFYQKISGSWVAGPRGTYIDSNGVYTGTVVADKITTGTLSATISIDAGSIKTGTLDAVTINASKITTGTLSAAIVNGSGFTAQTGNIADLAITQNKIANLTITNAQIADATIGYAKISTLSAALVNAVAIDAASITTGILSGRVIQTAATGQRVIINESSGNTLRAYSSAGTKVVEIGAPGSNGVLNIDGVTSYAISAKTSSTGLIPAIYGFGDDASLGIGVLGAGAARGVEGQSAAGSGVKGSSSGGSTSKGVYGSSTSGSGVYGDGTYGVTGSGTAVGVFAKSVAGLPLLIDPATGTTPPTGQRGAFWVDSGGIMYFHNGGSWGRVSFAAQTGAYAPLNSCYPRYIGDMFIKTDSTPNTAWIACSMATSSWIQIG